MTTAQPHEENASSARQAELDAARLLLDRMGISPADLVTASRVRREVPTFAQYIPQVRRAVSEGTRRVYGSYWNRVVDHWSERRLDEVSATDARQAQTRAARVCARAWPDT